MDEITVEYIAGASIAAAVAIDAETPQIPTPDDRVAEKFLSNPSFFEIKNATIHTTGKDTNTAANVMGALDIKDVNKIFAPKSTIAILINNSPLAEFINHVGICTA